jgi:uncharacterized oxidoreductase
MSSLGKVLLTGGTSGIGAELLKLLLRDGREVIVLARRTKELPSAQGLHTVTCDLARSDLLPALAENVLREHKGIRTLINAAGLQLARPLTDPGLAPEDVIAEAAVNLVAPALLSKAVLPGMIAGGGGLIVNLSSGLAVFPKERTALYCASKAGLSSLSVSLGWQVEAHGIRVMDVILPLVDTPMTRGRGGAKIPARAAAERIWRGILGTETTLRIGKARLLPWVARLAPSIGYRMMRHG